MRKKVNLDKETQSCIKYRKIKTDNSLAFHERFENYQNTHL